MVTSIMDDAKKVAYLVRRYPGKTIKDVLAMLAMPMISKDCALWEAERQGWVTIDKGAGTIAATSEDVAIVEDDSIQAIMDRITFGLRHQNEIEEDIDEVQFLEWLAGFPPHDVLISINMMLGKGKISNYEVHDGENIYTFYTLPHNVSQGWGKKRFKKTKGLVLKAKDELTV